jgi:hypothetical protein
MEENRDNGSVRDAYDDPPTDRRRVAPLADLDGYATLMRRTGLFRRSGQTSDGPVGAGTAYVDASRRGTLQGQVTDYQQPSRIGFCETLRWFGSELTEARPEYLLEGGPGQNHRSSRRGG